MRTPLLLASLLLLAMTACDSKKPANQTDSATATVDSAAALTKRPGPDAPRSAADRLVRALYFEHNKTENPFRETKDGTIIDQFFARPVADKIWQRVSQPGYKAPKANPLFNAPDADLKKIWVEPAAVGGSRAVVYVTYLLSGKPAEVRVDLQQTAGRWRITELTYPAGKTLTSLYP
ncbi:hypothetical protein [Fibrivirga algicola]|uniref:DUF3828 domain-containing protein n=1 Tax=Fibrivirga algicola TaxID=2950420 RepID=A0ABX0QGB3_9BACT|nr:hypothetical protein [Fibrivirga algicola]ARK10982.1 hypothetical protein A6C57_11945 [Fibrella sp. ES10-3-2-2]NID09768.1 hypothetical protein [Fibrivirga algicola]